MSEAQAIEQVDPPQPEASQNPTIYQAILDADLVVRTLIQSNVLNEGAIEIGEPTYTALMPLIGRAKLIDGEIIPYEPPAPPLPPIVLTADVLFFDRMTDAEYDDLDASVRAGETARVYRGWAAASSFTEGSDMWALLLKHLDLTVTAARRDDLLARP